MVTEADIRGALRSVIDPEIGRPIEDLGMLEGIEVEDDLVRIRLLLTVPGCPLQDRIDGDVKRAIEAIGVRRVEVSMAPMSDEQRASLVAKLRDTAPPSQPVFFTDGLTKVIVVASGKGGVGKSSVTVNLAVALAADGHRVGVLDADVWGFSVPRMMGLSGQPVGLDDMILPLEANGVKVVSMGFFVAEETPVIWRGPMLHKAIEQFLGDVYWGDLDFLLVDLPPGTGDVAISLASFLPGASMLVVTTPQDAARRVAERAGRMAEKTNLRPVGVIENMSWFACPHCGERTSIFGDGGGAETAEALGVALLGQVPLVPELRQGGDRGEPIVLLDPDSPAGRALREAARKVAEVARSKTG